jgi:hypothetical protein
MQSNYLVWTSELIVYYIEPQDVGTKFIVRPAICRGTALELISCIMHATLGNSALHC